MKKKCLCGKRESEKKKVELFNNYGIGTTNFRGYEMP